MNSYTGEQVDRHVFAGDDPTPVYTDRRLQKQAFVAGLVLLGLGVTGCDGNPARSHDVALVTPAPVPAVDAITGPPYIKSDTRYEELVGPLLCVRRGPATITSVQLVHTQGAQMEVTGFGLYVPQKMPSPTIPQLLAVARSNKPEALTPASDSCHGEDPRALVLSIEVKSGSHKDDYALAEGIQVNFKADSANGSAVIPRGVEYCESANPCPTPDPGHVVKGSD